jgi:lipid II:glycine glycyltransferase (peptidoglycan interpeptide bridge formation enzyme)
LAELSLSPCGPDEAAALSETAHGASMLQSVFWGELKSRYGWTPYYFCISGAPADARSEAVRWRLLLLTRRVGGIFTIGYVPHGPAGRAEGLSVGELARHLADRLPRKPTFIRFDLPWDSEAVTGEQKDALLDGSIRAPVDVQPPVTVMVPLHDDDTLLASMKSKTRYNVRLAAKRGVNVRDAGPGALDHWYDIYRETAARDRIAIHSRAYYQALFDTAAEHPGEVKLTLYMAEHEGDTLGGIIVGRHGEEAVYLYGASANVKRNLMAPYLLQWEAIRAARAAGAHRYDFFGIPPAENPGHPMHGLYRFKVGFGGAVEERPGSYDRPFQPIRYALFRRAEEVRQYYYKVLRKRIGRGRGGTS